jgi:hypothetical protein
MQEAKKAYRLEFLMNRHNELDQLIQDEYARYQDDRQVANLKKEKLELKDEIEQLKSELGIEI